MTIPPSTPIPPKSPPPKPPPPKPPPPPPPPHGSSDQVADGKKPFETRQENDKFGSVTVLD